MQKSEFTVEISLIPVVLDHKMSKEECMALSKKLIAKRIPIGLFKQAIQGGYSFSNVFVSGKMPSKKSFVSTTCMVVDIVKSLLTMDEYIVQMENDNKPLPTFAYVCIDDMDGQHHFKLVYCFSDTIYSYLYEDLYNQLLKRLDIVPDGNHKAGSLMSMIHQANPTQSFKLYETECIYKLDEFMHQQS